MKKILLLATSFCIFAVIAAFKISTPADFVEGAWQIKNTTVIHTLVCKDGYFSYVQFDEVNKKFIQSFGGTYSIADKQLNAVVEFDTKNKELIRKSVAYPLTLSNNRLTCALNNVTVAWKRLDDGSGILAGNWRITGRMQNGTLQQMQSGARKTLKLLSGTRFQWMAINAETKEFFGTGGGTYTYVNGKYTEKIDFFSRDSSRVGAVLSFDGMVSGKVWTHKGLNSRGEPLHEEWTREQ
jgi:hypothetical protein